MRVVWTTGVAVTMACVLAAPVGHASSHREAPITALDHKADITDVYAFRSYDGGATPRVTLIMCVDPLLEPANGPNWFPFDPDILLRDQGRQQQRRRRGHHVPVPVHDGTAPAGPVPGVCRGRRPASTRRRTRRRRSPPGTPIVPPQITSFDSAGLGTASELYRDDGEERRVDAAQQRRRRSTRCPANVGPRTMDYDALFNARDLRPGLRTCSVFAGTTDDPFWIDLGAAFDTLNLRVVGGAGRADARAGRGVPRTSRPTPCRATP